MDTVPGGRPVPPASPDAHELSSAMFERSLDAVMFTSPDGQILAANPAACRMLGMSEGEICRRGRSGLADPSDPRWLSGLKEREATGRFVGELSMLRGDGSAFPAEVSSAVFEDAAGARRTVVVVRDVSARKEAEARLTQLGHVDELTGALNRRGFFAAAAECLAGADHSGSSMTLLFVDVDRLKDLNDRWGYAIGDAALREVADLLRDACRTDDLVGRLGGDEFVVLARRPPGESALTLARRFEDRFHLRNAQGPRFPLRISVGAETVASDGTTVDDAIVRAHEAMVGQRTRARGGRRRPRDR